MAHYRSRCGYLFSRIARSAALLTVLWGAIAGVMLSHAQSIADSANASGTEDPLTKSDKSVGSEAVADPWGPAPAKSTSLANVVPVLLPYFNGGPVFGLPGTDVGDFLHRTQLTGDWGGLRTDLARRGFFFDLYSTSGYQDVASGGLKTGSAAVQNTQLSINVDTGRAGLWPGGLFHVTMESRYGSSSPQKLFTAGSVAPQYTALAFPGPFFSHDVLPTEYFLLQSLAPKFSVLLGKITVLTICDQTLFGDSFKYYFANFNFSKNPQALNFYHTTSLTAVGVWTPARWATLAGGVLDPNSQANNLATHAFDRVNIYGASIFSYKVRGRPGQSWGQANWTNKAKIDLASPFGQLPQGAGPQAIAVLLGSPSSQSLPINYKLGSWVTIANFSQYLFVKEEPTAIGHKLMSGQPLRGVGIFGRVGYAPEETNTITRDASLALFARGLSARRRNDSFGVGIYHNGISRPLKNDIARLTTGNATVRNEQGSEIFYDLAITPAIRLIPSYQHIWNPLTAEVTRNQRGVDVVLVRMTVTW